MSAEPSALQPARPRLLLPSSSTRERWSWYFFRLSGLALVFLAVGHVVIMHLINSVDTIDYQFVVERWRSAGWRVYDWLLLTLALTHGMNGLRVVIDDYVHRPARRRVLLGAAGLAYVVLLVAGTATVVTFRG